MSDNKVDKIFKEKLTKREFEFNPAAWEKMEAMLDGKKRRRAIFWWTLLGLLSLGLGIAVYFYTIGEPRIKNKLDKEKNITIEQPGTREPELVKPSQGQQTSKEIEEKKVLPPDPSSPLGERKGLPENISAKETSNADPELSDNTNLEPATSTMEFSAPYQEPLLLNKKPVIYDYRLSSDISLQNNAFIDPRALRKFQSQHELWLQAGPNFSTSYAGGQINTGWMAGINYRYRFAPFWHVNVGVIYSARISPGLGLSSDSIFYDFGKEVIRTKVEHSRLDYIEVPLTAAYDISPRHQVGLGMHAAVLINVRRNIHKTHFRFKREPEYSQSVENGLTENFRMLDVGINTYYFFQYTPQLGIGCELKYGFMDISLGNAEALQPFHRNVNARLILRYRLY